jgi:molybdate transport system substrate-binding protein
VKLVIGEPAVPIGAYTRAALSRLGLEAALGNVVSEEQDVRAIVAKVALGEADAGLAYLTDVRTAGDRVRAIPVPARAQPVVEYEVAVVSATPRRAAAEAYVARLLGEPGREALAGLGFGLPPAP